MGGALGAPEASFSPRSPQDTAIKPRPWYEGLKGPGDPRDPTTVPDGLKRMVQEYLGFVQSASYSRGNFAQAAQLGSKVIQEAGGWKEANEAVRKTWLELNGDHFEELHGDFFEGLVDDQLLSRARHNALFGIDARYEGGVGERVKASPHPSLREHFDEAAQQIRADAQTDRALLCVDDNSHLLDGVVSVALARVPKMLPDRTVSAKGRVVWDAKPINAFCDKARHPPALQPKHDEVTRLILWWQQRLPGLDILLTKKDVSEAFKWIPVAPQDTRLFSADLPGREFGIQAGNITVLYNSMTFGWTGAPAVDQTFPHGSFTSRCFVA